MSEPARALPTFEDDNQVAPGPLRDWLAAMRRYEAEPAEPRQAVEPDFVAAAADQTPWGPRLVLAEPPAEDAEAADISELMAENLMLKAKLKVEHDRQDALQSALAEQIRELREHIALEMESLEDMRAEQAAAQTEYEEFRTEREQFRRDRDALRSDRDRAAAERDAVRAERDALVAERDTLREDRDIWRARAEALAQPLFQPAAR